MMAEPMVSRRAAALLAINLGVTGLLGVGDAGEAGRSQGGSQGGQRGASAQVESLQGRAMRARTRTSSVPFSRCPMWYLDMGASVRAPRFSLCSTLQLLACRHF